MRRSRQPQFDPTSWRHVVITGGAAGLGAALAARFASGHALVSLVDRDADALERVSGAIIRNGGRVSTHVCDVSDAAAMERCISELPGRGATVDAAFLCAAVGDGEWIRTFDPSAFRRVIDTNLLGITNAMAPLIARMSARGFGVVVPISSMLDVRGYAGTAPYSTAKAALRSMCESARTLCEPRGIRVVLVRPSFMTTALAVDNHFHMPGLTTPEQAAEIIVRRLHRRSATISFPRWLAALAELIRLAPRPAFDALARALLRMEGLNDVLEYRAPATGSHTATGQNGSELRAAARRGARTVKVVES